MGKDHGLTGNLLVERLDGAHIDLVSKEEYVEIGSLVSIKMQSHKSLNNLFVCYLTYNRGWHLMFEYLAAFAEN